jgi:hypothetical protein
VITGIKKTELQKEKRAIMAPSKANSPEYAKDEKVLCFHLELLYEAKVLDSKPKDPNDKGDGYVYKIHYKGWKNTYVFCSFVLRFSCFSALYQARWQQRLL